MIVIQIMTVRTTIPNNLSCVNLIWNEIQYVCTWQVLRIVDCHGLGRIQGPGTECQFWSHPVWIWSLFQQFQQFANNFTVCQIKIDAVKLKLYHLYICNIILRHFLVKTFFEFSCQISGFLLLLVTSEDGKFGDFRNFLKWKFSVNSKYFSHKNMQRSELLYARTLLFYFSSSLKSYISLKYSF